MPDYELDQIVASDVGTVRVSNVLCLPNGTQSCIVGQILDGRFAGKWATVDVRFIASPVIGRLQ